MIIYELTRQKQSRILLRPQASEKFSQFHTPRVISNYLKKKVLTGRVFSFNEEIINGVKCQI